jgi:hypothetical protein
MSKRRELFSYRRGWLRERGDLGILSRKSSVGTTLWLEPISNDFKNFFIDN